VTFTAYLVLTLIEQFNGQRTLYAILHLLNGKRSSQTIQDGFLFKIHHFFGVLKSLSREQIEAIYHNLDQNGWVIVNDKSMIEVTEEGKEALNKYQNQFWISPHLNGWYADEGARLFWKRLSLIVQSVSHLVTHDNRFIPIVNDPAVHLWLKAFIQSYERKLLASDLFSELQALCQGLDEREAILLVYKLSGKGRSGLTIKQLADVLNYDEIEVQINFQATLHHVMDDLREKAHQFPLLGQLVIVIDRKPLTVSTYKTFLLLKQGKSIGDIVKERHLRLSTIQDHIVEIAFLDPLFPVSQFVPKKMYEVIRAVLKQGKVRRLAEIKKQLSDDIDYFHIRLVLAREKGGD